MIHLILSPPLGFGYSLSLTASLDLGFPTCKRGTSPHLGVGGPENGQDSQMVGYSEAAN